MWRVKTVTKFKNSFFPGLIYWNHNRIHLNTFKKSIFVPMVPPLSVSQPQHRRLVAVYGVNLMRQWNTQHLNRRSYIQLLIELVTTCCKRRSGLISFDKSYQQMMKQFSV